MQNLIFKGLNGQFKIVAATQYITRIKDSTNKISDKGPTKTKYNHIQSEMLTINTFKNEHKDHHCHDKLLTFINKKISHTISTSLLQSVNLGWSEGTYNSGNPRNIMQNLIFKGLNGQFKIVAATQYITRIKDSTNKISDKGPTKTKYNHIQSEMLTINTFKNEHKDHHCHDKLLTFINKKISHTISTSLLQSVNLGWSEGTYNSGNPYL